MQNTIDTNTYIGWIAAARRLLVDLPDWTGIVDGAHGFIVKLGDDIFAVANQAPGYIYSEDDLIELDQSAWSGEAWEDMTPERCRAIVEAPQFTTLLHAGSAKHPLILTTSQAQAVRSALLALAAVDAPHGAEFQIGGWVYVHRLQLSGAIHLQNRENGDAEGYADQAEFAAAYGLPVAAPDLAAALRVAYSDIQRLPGHTIDMLGRIEAALELSPV